MIYELNQNYTKIAETTGTIQNESHINTIEMSQSNQDSGILIYPLQKVSFSNKDVYLRATDGAARARVIPFTVDMGSSSDSGGSIETDSFNQDDIDDIFKP